RAARRQIGRDAPEIRPALHLEADRLGKRPRPGILPLPPGHRTGHRHQDQDGDGEEIRRDVAPHQPATRPRTSEALVPPKPKLLDSATLISRFTALFGARSSLGSTAGVSRLIVGGAT